MRVALVTVSDSAAQGTRPDRSGPALAERCRELGWEVVSAEVVLRRSRKRSKRGWPLLADAGAADLILTTGGTGLGPRDSTPEATAAVCESSCRALANSMREKGRQRNPRAALSRAVAGVRARSADREFAGKPARRGGIARRRGGTSAARGGSAARRAARLGPDASYRAISCCGAVCSIDRHAQSA